MFTPARGLGPASSRSARAHEGPSHPAGQRAPAFAVLVARTWRRGRRRHGAGRLHGFRVRVRLRLSAEHDGVVAGRSALRQQKAGALRVVKNGALLSAPFLTVAVDTTAERGLMGIAFDPAFSANRFVYVYYTFAHDARRTGSAGSRRAVEPRRRAGGQRGHPARRHPDPTRRSTTAARCTSDPTASSTSRSATPRMVRNAQNRAILPGKILRDQQRWQSPVRQPVRRDQTGRGRAIWAYGLRNPVHLRRPAGHRPHLHQRRRQATWEEIDEGRKGANYGWPTCEGSCNNPAFVNPIYQYNHNAGPGKSITGAASTTATTSPPRTPTTTSSVTTSATTSSATTWRRGWSATSRRTPLPGGPPRWPRRRPLLPVGRVEESKQDHVRKLASASAATRLRPDRSSRRPPTTTRRQASQRRTTGPAQRSTSNSTNPIDQAFLKWDLSVLAGKTVTSAQPARSGHSRSSGRARRRPRTSAWSRTRRGARRR